MYSFWIEELETHLNSKNIIISLLKMINYAFTILPTSSRDTLLGSDPAQLPRIQEEAVENERTHSGLRCGRLAHPVQRRL